MNQVVQKGTHRKIGRQAFRFADSKASHHEPQNLRAPPPFFEEGLAVQPERKTTILRKGDQSPPAERSGAPPSRAQEVFSFSLFVSLLEKLTVESGGVEFAAQISHLLASLPAAASESCVLHKLYLYLLPQTWANFRVRDSRTGKSRRSVNDSLCSSNFVSSVA